MHGRMDDYRSEDAPGVRAVFNHFVQHSFAAYPTEPVSEAFDAWLAQVAAKYPVITVRGETGSIIGFGLLRAYHSAGSFSRTAELTYFLLPGATGHGIGTALLHQLIDRGRAMGLRTLLANISSRNDQSLAFHRKHGFEEVGRFRSIGEKFGEEFDVVYMQRFIGAEPARLRGGE